MTTNRGTMFVSSPRVTADLLLSEFLKDIVATQSSPDQAMNRVKIKNGYVRHLEAWVESIRRGEQ